jgi:hypothetical protein
VPDQIPAAWIAWIRFVDELLAVSPCDSFTREEVVKILALTAGRVLEELLLEKETER